MKKLTLKEDIFIWLVVVFGNYWVFRLFRTDIFVALMAIIASLLLILTSYKPNMRALTISLALVVVVMMGVVIRREFDGNIFRITGLENDRIVKRREYYSQELGKIYRNRIGIGYFETFMPALEKYLSNSFSYLDYNLYFSASHPQERVGIIEFPKYPLILFPFFVLGVVVFLRFPNIVVPIYLSAAFIVSGFIYVGAIYGPVMFYPVINYFLFLSLVRIKGLCKQYE